VTKVNVDLILRRYNVNPHFGTADDIRALSKALHDRGMYLMMDVVANHMVRVIVLIKQLFSFSHSIICRGSMALVPRQTLVPLHLSIQHLTSTPTAPSTTIMINGRWKIAISEIAWSL
jgi:hypothetical protein